MLKSLAPKLVIGALGIGSVTAGTVYAFLPNKYSHYLSSKGRILLTKGSSKFEDLKNKYASEGDGLLITINEKEIPKNELTKEQLETWCLANSNNTFTNTKDKNYQRVSAWCTEPKSIKDYIDNSKTVLNDEEVNAGDHPNKTDWEAKKDEYSKLKTNDLLIKAISSSAETGEDIAATNLDQASKLRAWCKHSKEKHFKHEEDPRFLKYLKWCTK
ncbi:hypothetical protein A6V39_00785 [Candidatus Mycoplasma haematobovis]|uniref:Uncharacterized protein n=1 Tax=Candidatus Mycoplasma haematobovis TaxID=432608 RepID=A0A1A9QDN4_9MOLU|nr:hypothetical protein [Candidatus Mycoplasma haematobovis]OAL10587.1 hypothetical protein A6V39_00785 [Candidatus Mycoplasma haematobovis]